MPAQRLPWIKFWPEALEHEKFATLTDAESWSWVVIWGKASQQPKRWRFASIEHVHHVTKRSRAHVKRLIAVGLLDSGPEGVWVHDAPQWQDASNLAASQREPSPDHRQHSPNGGGSVAEGWRNNGATMVEAPAMGDLEGEGDIERDREEDGERDVTGAPRARLRVRAPARGNPRVQAVVDEFRKRDVEVFLTARDHAAIKHSDAPPELVAECYDAVARGIFGDDFMRKRLSIHEAVGWLNAYQVHKHRDQMEADPNFGEECSCAQRLEWLKINRNTNPYCDQHGDVRELVAG